MLLTLHRIQTTNFRKCNAHRDRNGQSCLVQTPNTCGSTYLHSGHMVQSKSTLIPGKCRLHLAVYLFGKFSCNPRRCIHHQRQCFQLYFFIIEKSWHWSNSFKVCVSLSWRFQSITFNDNLFTFDQLFYIPNATNTRTVKTTNNLKSIFSVWWGESSEHSSLIINSIYTVIRHFILCQFIQKQI